MFKTLAGVLLLIAGTALMAQNPTARITGTVTDATGAVLPGALVSVVNDETRQKIEGRTNDDGIFLISFVPPGSYSFSVEAQSFRRYTWASAAGGTPPAGPGPGGRPR